MQHKTVVCFSNQEHRGKVTINWIMMLMEAATISSLNTTSLTLQHGMAKSSYAAIKHYYIMNAIYNTFEYQVLLFLFLHGVFASFYCFIFIHAQALLTHFLVSSMSCFIKPKVPYLQLHFLCSMHTI